MPVLDYIIDAPPEHSLLSFDAFRLGCSHRIILTWEPSDKEIVLGDLILDLGYIVIYIDGTRVSEMMVVAIESELVLPARLPLIGPYRLEVR